MATTAAPPEPAAPEPAPRDAALRILRALFGEPDPAGAAGPARAFPLTTFQEEAARRLRAVIRRRGGALLADAVGLGKTFVALALVEERLRSGGDVVVVVPAALRRPWRDRLRRVAHRARRCRTADEVGGWRLASHAQLSRGAAIRVPTGPGLVVVDEAHRFRNPATLRYGALARLLRPADEGATPADALLITATPINNAVRDLYHLLRLFLPDAGLRDVGVPSLRAAFEPADPALVDAAVRAVVVRRDRRMVRDRFGAARPAARPTAPPAGPDRGQVQERVRFPRRAPPRIVSYADPGIRGRVAGIEALDLRAYGDSAGPLIRLGLLKRMDSSPAALALSLGRVRAFLEAFVDAARAGRLLRPGDRPTAGDADPLQLTILEMVADPAPPDLDLDALAASAGRDLAAIARLAAPVPDAMPAASADAKADALVRLVGGLDGEKAVVFTEYRDTAEALWRALAARFRVGRVDGAGAWLGTRRAGRRVVVERFAPIANGRPPPPDRERVDVLIATDVLAEGLDLQDARHVVSYDLPWNPVRLLQRIGRVDRLGSPHDLVVPHLFAPADGLDAVLGLTRRLRAKLDGIAATLGEEQADELLDGLAAGRTTAVDAALSAAEAADGRDPLERLRTAWLRVGPANNARSPTPDPDPPAAPPVVMATLRVPNDHPAAGLDAVALAVRGGTARLLELRRDGTVRTAGPPAAAALLMALDTDAAAPDDRAVGADVALRRVHEHHRVERLAAAAPPRLTPHDPERRLARGIRTALARAGSSLGPALVARAGVLLRALEAPVHPAARTAVARCADAATGPDADPESIIAAAERAVRGRSPLDAAEPTTVPALLRIVVDSG